MKKLLPILLFLAALCLPASSYAQAVQIGAQMRASATTTGTGIATPTTYYHQLTWTVVGSVTACSVTLDSSADNSSWSSGGAIGAQTCTSGGQSTLINAAVNYVRINLGTFTGTGSIYISYTGYSSGGNGTGGGFNPAVPGPIGGTTPSTGKFTTYSTGTNCADSTGTPACGSAAAGSFVVSAAATSAVVSTTAVTANSQIAVLFNSYLGIHLSVTCNVTVSPPTVTAISAGTSFTVSIPVGPVTNPACYTYSIVN